MRRARMPAVDLRAVAHVLRGERADHDALLELVADAQFVLLGEGSHGTHDFYHERAEITKRLITEKGFSAVETHALEPLEKPERWHDIEPPETYPTGI